MSGEKWTPGPWHFVSDEIGPSIIGDGRRVAIIGQRIMFYDDEDQTEANANLITAAPDLYAALELIYGRLLMSDRDGECRITAEDGEMAELALKKARGEL